MVKTIIIIISIFVLFYLYNRFYLIRNLRLKNLEDWIKLKSLSSIQVELKDRKFNYYSTSNNKTSEMYQRHKGDYILIPTDKYDGRKYVEYKLPNKLDSENFIEQMNRGKYNKIENPDFEAEGFSWMGIEKTSKIDDNIILDEEVYIIDGRTLKQCSLYKNGDYSIITISNMSNHSDKSFLIYK